MMEEHIGFPDYILDPVLLDKDFDHVSFFCVEHFSMLKLCQGCHNIL